MPHVPRNAYERGKFNLSQQVLSGIVDVQSREFNSSTKLVISQLVCLLSVVVVCVFLSGVPVN